MIAVAKQKRKIRFASRKKNSNLCSPGLFIMNKKNLILLLAVIFSSLVSWLKTNTADIGTVKWTHVIQSDQKACPFFVPRSSSSSKRRFLWPYFSARIPNFVLVSFTIKPFHLEQTSQAIKREQNRQLTCHNTAIPRLKSISPAKAIHMHLFKLKMSHYKLPVAILIAFVNQTVIFLRQFAVLVLI